MPTRFADSAGTSWTIRTALVALGMVLAASGCAGTTDPGTTDPGAAADQVPVVPVVPTAPATTATPKGRTGQAAQSAPRAADVDPVIDLVVPDGVIDPSVVTAPPDVVSGLRSALQERAAAVVAGDEGAFRAGLAPEDPAFLAAQQMTWANLRQLPIQVYDLAPDPATVVRAGPGSYWVNVEVGLQLQGFDAAPVVTVDRYLLTTGSRGGAFRLASATDAAWETRNGVQTPLWEARPLLARSAPGVLGLVDRAGEADAGSLVRAVQAGIEAVAPVLPYPWSRSVVVVALSDDTFLRSLPMPAGADSGEVDAVAYPVPGAQGTVGVRLALHPRLLGRDGRGRDRLLRHELTHVALGELDDHVPLWLGEGLAELVSVQPEAPSIRRVQPAALAAAQAGLRDLPEDATFFDDAVAEHYGVSWWACDYVLTTAGADVLWSLLEQMQVLGSLSPLGVPDAVQQSDLLVSVLGINRRTLARKAGKRLLAAVPVTDPAPDPALVPAPAPVTAPVLPP